MLGMTATGKRRKKTPLFPARSSGLYKAVAQIAFAIAVIVGVGNVAVGADVMAAAVALAVVVKVVVVGKTVVTIAHKQLAHVALLIAVGIYAAKLGHTVDLAHLLQALLTLAVAVGVAVGLPFVATPTDGISRATARFYIFEKFFKPILQPTLSSLLKEIHSMV